eukprot:Clim_evm13s39 gene=Clim_evmTU13s39
MKGPFHRRQGSSTSAKGHRRTPSRASTHTYPFPEENGRLGSGRSISSYHSQSASELPHQALTLQKWTNYFMGWQPRYFTLLGGVLSYYTSQEEAQYGCRGSINLKDAEVRVDEYDPYRLDVILHDTAWFIRFTMTETRQVWLEDILLSKEILNQQHGGSDTGSQKHSSSASSMQSIREELVRQMDNALEEIDTYRDVLDKQTVTMSQWYELLMNLPDLEAAMRRVVSNGEVKEIPVNFTPANLRENSVTFKSTVKGMMDQVEDMRELFVRLEEEDRARIEDKNRKIKELEKELTEARRNGASFSQTTDIRKSGPDFMEGPYSRVEESEFFDAIDEADHIQEMRLKALQKPESPRSTKGEDEHEFSETVRSMCEEFLVYANEDINTTWKMVYTENGLDVYRRDETTEGDITVDKLKANHYVPGQTAFEFCDYYYDIDRRRDWEGILETVNVIEFLDKQTLVAQNLYKQVWPAAQREALVLNHLRREPNDSVMVVCKSVEHPKCPIANGVVRVSAFTGMVCTTEYKNGKGPDSEGLTRDDIGCRVVYFSEINPGGWLPPSIVRQASKREYPKVLQAITMASTSWYKSKAIDHGARLK